MTNSSKHFVSYSPCPSNRKIIVADGSIMTVAGQGDVSINSTLVLRNVLHVPKLCTSLISVQKLTTDSNDKCLCHFLFKLLYSSGARNEADDWTC